MKYYAQVQKYVDNIWKANPNQQLRTGSAKIAGGQFYFDSGYDQYYVTYSYTGGGIISYEYTKVTDWDQVKEDALVAGTVIITIVAGVAVISTAGSAGAAAIVVA